VGNVNGCRLLDAILLPVKAEAGTDVIFTYGVHSHKQYCSNLLPLPQTIANRLSHGQNLKIVNLRDQASRDSANVPFKKPLKYADYVSSANFIKSAKMMLVFPTYARNYASTINKGLL